MIERIEFEGWDGIAAGELYPLSSRTVLVCSNERCRGAILGALGFFRIEEEFASVYERIWRRSRPIGAATFASLVSDGRATIRARVDGRDLCLKLDVPESCRLRGTIAGEDAPSFEIGIDERQGHVFGLRGLPNGPRTMARLSFFCEVPQPGLAGGGLRPITAHYKQVILLAPDLSTVDDTFLGLRDDERAQWTVLPLALDRGVLHAAP